MKNSEEETQLFSLINTHTKKIILHFTSASHRRKKLKKNPVTVSSTSSFYSTFFLVLGLEWLGSFSVYEKKKEKLFLKKLLITLNKEQQQQQQKKDTN